MNVLVTGGAGYIGSHFVLELLAQGHNPVIYDNLSTGFQWAVMCDKFYQGSIHDGEKLTDVLKKEKIEAVVHFAAFSQVGESISNPPKYFHNNYTGTMSLLDSMVKAGVGLFVLSSTAAVYGLPEKQPVAEDALKKPINPYGLTKYFIEESLPWYEATYGIKYMSLRYFNAAGADPEARTGEAHMPESHLVPLVLLSLLGKRDNITVFGTDYDTPDGSCIRDYIHVADLCQAHTLALNALANGKSSSAFNLGTSKGASVLEVIKAAEDVTGISVSVKFSSRREGDPPVLVADSSMAREHLGWKPVYEDLNLIVKHAYSWAQKAVTKGYIS